MDLSRLVMHDEPYPYGVAQGVFDPHLYDAMVSNFPQAELARQMGSNGYRKMSLSERFNGPEYREFIEGSSLWKEFHGYIKSSSFRADVLMQPGVSPMIQHGAPCTSRFEFSFMPADGGYIAPHTDIPTKIVTLVIPMVQDWDRAWGGGTDILRPLDPNKLLRDYAAPLSEFEKVATVEFLPNQALVFIKSERSWHSAGPFAGPEGQWRKSLTINIERAL